MWLIVPCCLFSAIQDSLPEDENANTASVDQRIQKNQVEHDSWMGEGG